MRLHQMADALDLRELTPAGGGDEEIIEGYTSDLLSDILAHAPSGGVLVTIQVSPDLVVVAGLVGLRAVIFSCGRTPDDDVIGKAAAGGLSLFESLEDSFEVVGQLYESGLRGGHRQGNPHPGSPHGHRRRSHAEPGWLGVQSEPLQTGE